MLQDLFTKLGKKVVFTILGVVGALAWFTVTGSGEGKYESRAEMPEVVFGGGGGTIVLDVTFNQPGEVSATFSQYDEATDEEDDVQVRVAVDAGEHRFEVDVAKNTYLYFEAQIHEPTVGAKIVWNVRLDDRLVYRGEENLTKPLEPRYAFFDNVEADSVAEMRGWSR